MKVSTGCSRAMAADTAGRSREKSAARKVTPTYSMPAKPAIIRYMTKPGSRERTLRPGAATASASIWMISSEPLPSTSCMSAGTAMASRRAS